MVTCNCKARRSPIRLRGQSGDEWVTAEEYIDGKFTKYLNNTGIPCGVNSKIRQKCESLARFSYERSHENIMVVDMQGLQLGSLAFKGWFTLLAGIDFLHIIRA